MIKIITAFLGVVSVAPWNVFATATAVSVNNGLFWLVKLIVLLFIASVGIINLEI